VKNSRLPLLLLPVLVVVIVWALPFRMMQKSTAANDERAASAESQAKGLESQVQTAQAAQARQAELKAELAKIRAVLPDAPEQFLSPVIRAISDAAGRHDVIVSSQDQESAVGAANAAAAAPAPDANGNAAEPAPKSFGVRISVAGRLSDVLGFIADMPSTQRLFVEKISVKPAGEAGFAADGKTQVKADLDLKAYLASTATATGS
jgi:hypothetical protein